MITPIDPARFSHSDLTETVSYDGEPIVVRTPRGWFLLGMGHSLPDAMHRAAVSAIWSLPNDASASDMRRRISDNLQGRDPS